MGYLYSLPLLLVLMNPASCITQEEVSPVPDYAKWQVISETAEEFLYNKESVLLMIKIFNHVDSAGMHYSVGVIDDLEQKPWLLFIM